MLRNIQGFLFLLILSAAPDAWAGSPSLPEVKTLASNLEFLMLQGSPESIRNGTKQVDGYLSALPADKRSDPEVKRLFQLNENAKNLVLIKGGLEGCLDQEQKQLARSTIDRTVSSMLKSSSGAPWTGAKSGAECKKDGAKGRITDSFAKGMSEAQLDAILALKLYEKSLQNSLDTELQLLKWGNVTQPEIEGIKNAWIEKRCKGAPPKQKPKGVDGREVITLKGPDPRCREMVLKAFESIKPMNQLEITTKELNEKIVRVSEAARMANSRGDLSEYHQVYSQQMGEGVGLLLATEVMASGEIYEDVYSRLPKKQRYKNEFMGSAAKFKTVERGFLKKMAGKRPYLEAESFPGPIKTDPSDLDKGHGLVNPSLVQFALEEARMKNWEGHQEITGGFLDLGDCLGSESNVMTRSCRFRIRKSIDKMIAKSPAAAGAVLNELSDFLDPTSTANLYCKSFKRIADQAKLDQNMQNAVVWGGLIVGGVLMVTGIGAAVGGALAASAAAAATATTVGGYAFIGGLALGATTLGFESVDAVNKYDSYRSSVHSVFTGNSDGKGAQQLEEEYQAFIDARNNAALSAGFMIVDIAGLGQINDIKRLRNLKALYQNEELLKTLKLSGVHPSEIEKTLLEMSANPKMVEDFLSGKSVRSASAGSEKGPAEVISTQAEGGKRPLLEKPLPSASAGVTSSREGFLKFIGWDPQGRARKKLLNEYDLTADGVRNHRVRDQGQSGTCSVHAACSMLEMNGALPKGKTIDLQYVDGLRIWERMNGLFLNGQSADAAADVKGILGEGNYDRDILDLFAERAPPLISIEDAAKPQRMFQKTERADLQKELIAILDSKDGIEHQQKMLDQVMRKYYGDVRVDRSVRKSVKGGEFVLLRHSDGNVMKNPELKSVNTQDLNKRMFSKDVDYFPKVVDEISEEGSLVRGQTIFGSSKTQDLTVIKEEVEGFLHNLAPVSGEANTKGRTLYMKVEGVYKRVSRDPDTGVLKDYNGNPIPAEKQGGLFMPKDETYGDVSFPGKDVVMSRVESRYPVMRGRSSTALNFNEALTGIGRIESEIIDQLSSGKSIYATFAETGYQAKGGLHHSPEAKGLHAMVIVGAKLNPDGSLKEILLANSWGKDAGKQGFYSLPWGEDVKKQLVQIIVQKNK
ncbi:MAG: hypothetical protein KGP28_05280 [Bdellovibrionales bacterium]|nr:hypothetical protein [Bdellovibrionales bacterium]